MKTIADAVNDHKGVWPYDNFPYMMQSPNGYYGSGNIDGMGEFEILVCTQAQFNQLIKELNK